MNRRTFLAAGLGALLISGAARAAWPEAAFEADQADDVLARLGGQNAAASDAITITAPDIAENGAVVPISVSTTLPEVTRVSILVASNPLPLTSTYDLAAGAVPYVATRVKMLKTSDVVALVEAGGRTYSAAREVKVTIGGCGG